jgi:uncharacterized protein
MDIPIQVDLGRIAQDLQIRRVQVESVVLLLDEGNTVPFITRYRKERTGNLNEVVIQEIQLRVQRLRELAERKETILKAIEAQGKLTPDLTTAIRSADNPKRLEDLYLPFKPKKRTKASDARERGLEPLAFRIWTRDETLTDLTAAAQELVNAEKGIDTVEKVLEGVGHILSEAISEMATVRDGIRKVVWKTGKVVTSKNELPEGQGLEYRDYFDYSEPAAQIPPHRILAINRGDKEGPLKVRIEVSRPDTEAVLFSQLPLEGHPQADLFRAAGMDALDRLILPSMEREVRRDLTEGAEKHAVEVFAKNLRGLLLQPPIPKQVVLAIDPGFRTGCKLAVLDRSGNLIDQAVIYPHPPQSRRSEAKVALKDLVGKHQVAVVAIGNGTACRETEELVAEIIAEGAKFSDPDYVPPPEPEPEAQAAPESSPTTPLAGEEGHSPAAVAEAVEPSHHDQGEPQASGESASVVQHEPPSEVHPPSDNHASAHPDDGVASSVPDSHSAGESHHAPVAEAPLEALPPISGGSPEAEVDVPSGEASSTNDAGSTAVMNAADGEGEGGGAGPETTAASGTEPEVVESSEPAHHAAPEASAEAPEAAAVVSEESPPAGGESAEPSAAAAPAEGAAPASPAPGRSGKQSGPRPPRQPKQGGQGKSDGSRSRSGRQRHGPPPVQEPPRPHPADAQLAQLAYVVVNEAGASVYSTSQVGRDELPELDATLRSGISIGRRLQDPLSELVKIEPQNIGVGLYQHDVNPKQLKETLENVIDSCVNFVGVDLNTASVPLLRHVSGLNQLTARRIADYRKEHGPFTSREQLSQVEGVGPATFTQAAGFLKISDGAQPLDRTWIHPESYPAAIKLLEKLEFAPEVVSDKARLPELNEKLAKADPVELARELEVGEFTLRDIVEALARPERDPREDLPKPIFKKGILKIEDLTAGMELKGTVLNVVDFGAFVDIGLKDSGLVHISQLANRYVKSPHDVVSVGDVVTVWVMGVDHERKRVSLTMVKPGTERQQRAQQGGGGRRGPDQPREGDRDNRGPGQGRRGGGAGGPRPPRPVSSALTSPPVGSPSVAVLAETPAAGRRPDRDRGGPGPGGGGPRHSDHRGPGPGPGSQGPPGPGGGPPRHGHGPEQGRGGPRGYQGQGGDRSGGRPDRGPGGPPRPADRPRRPSPPPPPLSKDALAGNVPLRTFGQLKQLWEAKVEPKPGELPGSGGEAPGPMPAVPPASSEAPPSHPQGSDAASPPPASTAPAEPDAPEASN